MQNLHFYPNLDRQTVQIERIYVFDNNDMPPPDIRGTVVVVSEKISLYQAWNTALAMVKTPYVMNLNLDDRLAPDAIAVMERRFRPISTSIWSGAIGGSVIAKRKPTM